MTFKCIGQFMEVLDTKCSHLRASLMHCFSSAVRKEDMELRLALLESRDN